jgi:hypothetical protein
MIDTPTPNESPIDDEFDESFRARIKAELDPGEPLLWAGRPIQERQPIGRGTVTAAIAGVLFLLLAAACLTGAYLFRHREVGVLVFVAVLALIVDFFIVLGLVHGASDRKAKRQSLAETTYALTDRRVIIWLPVRMLYGTWMPGGPSTAIQVVSHPRSAIREIHRVEYTDGSGDIQIRRADEEGSWSSISLISHVADVRRVERLIRDTLLGGIDPA